MIFIIILLVTYFLNIYIIICGKRDLEKLKNKISISKYFVEINDSLISLVGRTWSIIIKVSLVTLGIALVLSNALYFLFCIGGFILGTFAAKKSYQIPFFNNYFNKIITYINRLK